MLHDAATPVYRTPAHRRVLEAMLDEPQQRQVPVIVRLLIWIICPDIHSLRIKLDARLSTCPIASYVNVDYCGAEFAELFFVVPRRHYS